MFWYKHQNFSTVHCGEAARNLWWYGHVEVIEIGSGWSKNRKRIIAKLEFQKCHKHALSLIPTQFAAMKIISNYQVELPGTPNFTHKILPQKTFLIRQILYSKMVKRSTKIEKGRIMICNQSIFFSKQKKQQKYLRIIQVSSDCR